MGLKVSLGCPKRGTANVWLHFILQYMYLQYTCVVTQESTDIR